MGTTYAMVQGVATIVLVMYVVRLAKEVALLKAAVAKAHYRITLLVRRDA